MHQAQYAVGKVAWTVDEYCVAIGCKRSKLYLLIADGAIQVRKLGRRTLITTPPAEFISRLPVA